MDGGFQMIEKYIENKRGKIYYWISDEWVTDRATIFFFHGLTQNHTLFDNEMSYFEGKYNLIVWDAPMYGKSRPYNEFSFPNNSKDILQIMDDNKVKSIIAVGQSMGGSDIQSFMTNYPDKIMGFLLLGSIPHDNSYYTFFEKLWFRSVEKLYGIYPLDETKKYVAQNAVLTKIALKKMNDMMSIDENKEEFGKTLQVKYHAFLDDRITVTYPCPGILMYGQYDTVGKVMEYSKPWAENSGLPVEIILNAGHCANLDKPDYVNKLMEDFIEEKILKNR